MVEVSVADMPKITRGKPAGKKAEGKKAKGGKEEGGLVPATSRIYISTSL